MNSIFRSFIVLGEVAALGRVSLRAQFGWDWDMTNTCGARPQGPKYAYPEGNATYMEPGNCDIIPNGDYVFNYECSTNCLMDEAVQVLLKCNCLVQVGPIEIPVDCKWEYENGIECPEVPVEKHFDWECDPRNGPCAQGQYQLPAGQGGMMPGMWPGMFPGMMPGMGMPMMPAFNPAMFNLTTTHGNATEMFQAGMPGYINHVYVAPVMHQTIGDVSDGGDDFGATSGGNSSTSGHNGKVYSMDAAKLVEFETELAEEREKSRGFKSKIHAASAAFKRERLQYEEQLRQKDQAREEILDQLRMLQSLIHSAATESDTEANSPTQPEYEDEELEEGKEGNPKILNLMLNDAPAIAQPLLETHHQEPESRRKRKAKKAKKPKKTKKEPSL